MRWAVRAMALTILVVVIFMLLTGCGAPDPGEMTDDERYRLCVEKGGSFKREGGSHFTCDMPERSE